MTGSFFSFGCKHNKSWRAVVAELVSALLFNHACPMLKVNDSKPGVSVYFWVNGNGQVRMVQLLANYMIRGRFYASSIFGSISVDVLGGLAHLHGMLYRAAQIHFLAGLSCPTKKKVVFCFKFFFITFYIMVVLNQFGIENLHRPGTCGIGDKRPYMHVPAQEKGRV